MRLQYICYRKEREPHPFPWNQAGIHQSSLPCVRSLPRRSEIRARRDSIQETKPNLAPGELQTLKKSSRDKTIILKKAENGTTSIVMSKESKINEGLALLNEKNNYQPLTQPMAETATRKVTQLIKSLLQESHIDDMTAKWLSLTPNPPRIPFFYTLTKIHKPTPVGRPIISGCDGPTERISVFVDQLIQPIAPNKTCIWKIRQTSWILLRVQDCLKIVLVSMDVTSLYTTIPHEEGVTTVCHAVFVFVSSITTQQFNKYTTDQ